MGREKSDSRTVPEGRRKAVPSQDGDPGGGKATTASEQATQLDLFFEPVDSPKGAARRQDTDRSVLRRRRVPLSKAKSRGKSSAMTMKKVSEESNLREAFRRVASNDGAPGPDRRSVSWMREHLEETLPELQRELLSGNYRPGEIRRVWIPKPGGQRGLGIPDVIDRWVQQAIAQVLSPHWVASFHPSSHGFIEGRSCHTAIREACNHLESGAEWVVDLDLEEFFDRVNHQRLLSRLEQKVGDRLLLEVIRRLLKAKIVMPDGLVRSNNEGVPQGGPLSPLLSNIVLDELDWELSRRGHRFVRYADDCNIYVNSERSGRRVMAGVTRFLARRLRLRVNESKSAVARPRDRHFLGFRLHLNRTSGEVEVKLSRRSEDRIKRKIRALTPRNWGQSLRACIRQLNGYLSGWIGFFWVIGDRDAYMLHEFEGHIRRRLRAIVLRHWKRKRTIYRRLLQSGARRTTAARAVYGGKKSWWTMSRGFLIHKALPIQYFTDLGLISIKERRQALQARYVLAQAQLRLPLG